MMIVVDWAVALYLYLWTVLVTGQADNAALGMIPVVYRAAITQVGQYIISVPVDASPYVAEVIRLILAYTILSQ